MSSPFGGDEGYSASNANRILNKPPLKGVPSTKTIQRYADAERLLHNSTVLALLSWSCISTKGPLEARNMFQGIRANCYTGEVGGRLSGLKESKAILDSWSRARLIWPLLPGPSNSACTSARSCSFKMTCRALCWWPCKQRWPKSNGNWVCMRTDLRRTASRELHAHALCLNVDSPSLNTKPHQYWQIGQWQLEHSFDNASEGSLYGRG